MDTLVRDVIAGVTLALTSVPQAVAYAEVSGVAGWRGLATMGVPCVAFSFVTGSPWASIGVTSITALMARTALAPAYDALGEEEYVAVYGTYAVAVGLASAFLAACGAADVAVRRVPASVKAGFKLGFGCAVISSQCPNALFAFGKKDLEAAFAADGGAFAAAASALAGARETPAGALLLGGAASALKVVFALTHPGAWDPAAAAVAAVVCLGTLHGKKLLPAGAPPGVEVLALVGVAAYLSAACGYAGGVVGAPPSGGGSAPIWERIALPTDLPWKTLLETCFAGSAVALARSALTFAAVDFLQSISVCSAFEAENGRKWSPARELLGQGVASVASGAAGGGPCGASLSRSMLARMTGGASPRAGLFHGVAAIVLLPYAYLMKDTPKAALAAVVIAAVGPGVCRPKAVLKLGAADALVAWSTALASVVADPTTGFCLGLAFAALVSTVAPKKKTA